MLQINRLTIFPQHSLSFFGINHSARAGLLLAIELVYELTAAGLSAQADKCRLGPATRSKHLGTICDALRDVFRLPRSRQERIVVQLGELVVMAR